MAADLLTKPLARVLLQIFAFNVARNLKVHRACERGGVLRYLILSKSP